MVSSAGSTVTGIAVSVPPRVVPRLAMASVVFGREVGDGIGQVADRDTGGAGSLIPASSAASFLFLSWRDLTYLELSVRKCIVCRWGDLVPSQGSNGGLLCSCLICSTFR